ncbi:MAG TPA: hypothetical protein VNT77_08475 [Allosphingosinicella sp.]|nr:hypothetical protein [Allosphingosinicella sp.]
MFRTVLLSLTLATTPAFAGPYYTAEPAAKPTQAKLIVRDTIWNCGDAGCSANKSNSRPAIVCALLVREVGALRSFSAGGQALSAEQLEKCNARAG